MKQSIADVIVIGGGHAGLEAALAASRRGLRVTLITLDAGKIGEMSCNPAVGGLGKGHLVREIDALDGALGQLGDASGIQFRLLNRRKGPAVRGPRVQCDRALFRAAAQSTVRAAAGLTVITGEVTVLEIRNGRIAGVRLVDDTLVEARAVVLTTGTFLGGVIHIGREQHLAGRMGEAAATRLSAQLREAAFALGRLKTGTPPRLDAATVDWSRLQPQPGDEEPAFLSFETSAPAVRQLPCHVAHTNAAVHAEIAKNIGESAMHSGRISGPGPRYCPSIEDKITRFADKESHQIFLEPEGLDSPLIYPNGISTSLPVDVQQRFVRHIEGLERVEIRQPGYAIEYDYLDPRGLTHHLAHREVAGLFLAGQINGTTGYEEAAAQGLVAGANAAAFAADLMPLEIDRATGYIGVMIDDLVNRGVTEPYRMFTSRAEYRLHLRIDNADQRLTPAGIACGLVGPARQAAFAKKVAKLDEGREALAGIALTPNEAKTHGIALRADGARRDGWELLALPDIAIETLSPLAPGLRTLSGDIRDLLEIEAQYRVYLDRQAQEIDRLHAEAQQPLAEDIDYAALAGLSTELRNKLSDARPRTVAQARRIEGMTPAALLLLLAAGRGSRTRRAAGA